MRLPIKALAKELSLLVGVAVAAAVIFNSVSPNGVRLLAGLKGIGCAEKAKPAADEPLYEFEIESVFRARAIYDQGKAVFVDARDEDYFGNGHIKGAVSLPVNRFSQKITEFKNKYPIGTSLVSYCHNRACRDSYELARYLFEAGYTNVSVYPGGFWAWEREGFPVE